MRKRAILVALSDLSNFWFYLRCIFAHVLYVRRDYKQDMIKNASIPYYTEINGFLETLPLPGRTINPNQATYHNLAIHFEEVYVAYERSSDKAHIEARLKLLALLYRVKSFLNEQYDATRFASLDQSLLSKYLHLVNSHYIEKRTVKEYADLLSISPNQLSQTIKTINFVKPLERIGYNAYL
jgi:hypothetical protein